MSEEKSSTALFAVAGLLAPVVAAWVLLFAVGSMKTNWLLAGVLALGAGMLVVNLIQRFVPGVFDSAFEAESEEGVPDAPGVAAFVAEEPDDADPDAPAPRMRILLASSGLQGLSVGLLIAYFLGDPVVSVVIGLIFGALGADVSTVLARNLSATA